MESGEADEGDPFDSDDRPYEWREDETEGPTATVEEKKTSATDRTDLLKLFHAQMGGAASCIPEAARAELAPRVTFSVSASVDENGKVTDASASGDGLDDSMIECVRKRAEAIALPAEKGRDEIAISADVAFDVTPTKRTDKVVIERFGEVIAELPPDALNDVPRAPGSVPASSTLPAMGADPRKAPGSGYAAPDSTLPALAPDPRKAPNSGYVPPDSTLPAVGQ
ncbi:MAG: hypothetical protein R3A78_08850 [Polyangiales bacterium]|nr:hypothetical protein [Myxococcales bacterium]